ncbi:MAG: serine/threonine-protein kinase [Byssovorax sp.]
MNTMQLAVGEVVGGRYRVEGELGRGGMAVVYRATHTGTGKPCALKLVHPQLVTRRELVDLFVREAQITGRIGNNPHIVDVFDAGADERTGVPFIAMELLSGETLAQILETRGGLAPSLLRAVVLQLADALDQAHRAGVIHRDLKPSNLFLTTDRRGEPLLKVLDFGIAKVLEQEAARTATQIGTPAYAAPEQMGPTLRRVAEQQGVTIAAQVSPSTDVWALGLIVFELCTGLPTGHFWGVDSLAELPAKIVLEPAEPASVRAGDRAPNLPPGFDAWFARCMRRNAAERWATAGLAASELLHLLDAAGPAVQPTAYGAPIGGGSTPPPSYGPGATHVAGYEGVPSAPHYTPPSGPQYTPPSGPQYGPPPGGYGQPPPSSVPMWGVATPQPPQYGYPQPPPQQPYLMPRPQAPASSGARAGVIIGVVVILVMGFLGAGGFALYRVGDHAAARTACTTKTQRCDEACDSGDSSSCVRYGLKLERGDGIPRDLARAGEFYKKACDAEDTLGCADLGLLRANGRGGPVDKLGAVALYQQACDAGGLFGCDLLGGMYEAGEGGLPKDPDRAYKLYDQACNGGELSGCKDLGSLYELGTSPVTKDEARAAALYKRVCDGHDVTGCTSLGVMYETGRGGLPKDETRSVALYQQGCDGHEKRACRFLGWMYESGKGTTKDEKHAAALYRTGCDDDDLLACNNLGVMYENGRGGLPKDTVKSAELYKKACAAGDMLGCNNLGVMAETGRGGGAKDEAGAAALYQQACDGGDAHGCRNLGGLYEAGRGVAKDELRAVALYKKACDQVDMRACVSLGWMYEMGHGGLAKDDRRAGELYKQGCEGGDAVGCNNYGVMLESARGGLVKDEKHAAKLYETACDGGSNNACSSLGWFLFQGRVVPQDKVRGVALLRTGCLGGNTWGCDRLKETGNKP